MTILGDADQAEEILDRIAETDYERTVEPEEPEIIEVEEIVE
jgi:hypothetical protein